MEEMPSKVLNNLPQGGLTPVFSHVIVALSMTGSDCLRRKIFPLSVTSRQVLFRFVFLSFQRIWLKTFIVVAIVFSLLVLSDSVFRGL